MILGEFNRDLKEALCHLKQTEPFTSWLNAIKREIKELKKGSGRKPISFGSPKRLWDDCLKLESYIRSKTAHGIYKFDGEVPETIMSSETSNISQFFEFEFLPYPNDHFWMGRYLGPSIDIGFALMAKIIKEYGPCTNY